MAANYIELFGDRSQVHIDDLALIDRRLSIRPGTVLDLSCGPGHLTAHLRSREVDAIGIDLVPEFIHHARATHADDRYAVGSLHELPVPGASVAGILAWDSLIHLPPHRTIPLRPRSRHNPRLRRSASQRCSASGAGLS